MIVIFAKSGYAIKREGVIAMKELGVVCVVLSLVAVILSVISALAADVWLPATQWVLIAATLGIYAVYLKK